MKSAIAIITYSRRHALAEMLKGISKHCSAYPLGIFEDCGQADDTCQWLRTLNEAGTRQGIARPDLLATQYSIKPNWTAFLGTTNLGVSGNSNRALRWFMQETDADHLLLCNDDLHVLGDFPAFYGQAHQDLGVGFFCFNDFAEWPTHRWIIIRSRGYRLKWFRRYTGIMMSTLRSAIESVGYFDTRFGKFGEEHSDWTNRMRFAGQIRLDGTDHPCLDVEPEAADGLVPVLGHQNVETSVTGHRRAIEDKLSITKMQEAAARYTTDGFYRPFSLIWESHVGVGSTGIPVKDMKAYASTDA